MIDKKYVVSQEVGMLLSKFSEFENSNYAYVKHFEVKDEIMLKHAGVIDDDYINLTKEHGGRYETTDVYKENVDVRRNYGYGEVICPAPTLYEVDEWLREVYGIYMYVERDTYWKQFRWVFECDHPRGKHTGPIYKEYNDAFERGIVACIEHIENYKLKPISQ